MSTEHVVLQLFDRNENRAKASSQLLGRRASAHLDRLSDGLVIPQGLRGRVSFDPDCRELVYLGFMSSADYCFLRHCNDDLDYLRAVDELHHQASFEPLGRPQLVPTWLWALVMAAFALAFFVWLGWLISSK